MDERQVVMKVTRDSNPVLFEIARNMILDGQSSRKCFVFVSGEIIEKEINGQKIKLVEYLLLDEKDE